MADAQSTMTTLKVVPVKRQTSYPVVLLDVIIASGVIALVFDTPEMTPWWRIVVAVLLVVVPAAITMPALARIRKPWDSATPAPQWATVEPVAATIRRFIVPAIGGVILIAIGYFTRTLPALGLVALGLQAAFAHHLGRVMQWERDHDARLVYETGVATGSAPRPLTLPR